MNVLINQELIKDIEYALNSIVNTPYTGRDGKATDTYALASRVGHIARAITPKPLDVYTNGDNDQPTTCPKCGSRTYFHNMSSAIQHHTCRNEHCRYEFALEVDPEPEEPVVDDSLKECYGCAGTFPTNDLVRIDGEDYCEKCQRFIR